MTSGALTFHAVDAVHVPGRGLIFTGPWPISGVIDQRSEQNALYHATRQPWRIVHPKADPDQLYRVRGVEAHCLPTLREGAPVGLLVTPLE